MFLLFCFSSLVLCCLFLFFSLSTSKHLFSLLGRFSQPPLYCTTPKMEGKRVKLVFEDGVVRRLQLPDPIEFEALTKFLDLISDSNPIYHLSYLDEEGDSITVATDAELTEAFQVCGQNSVLKLKVVVEEQPVKQEKKPSAPQTPPPSCPFSSHPPPPSPIAPPPPPSILVEFIIDLFSPSRRGDPPFPFDIDLFLRCFLIFSIPLIPFLYQFLPICAYAYVSAAICFVLVVPFVAPGLNRLAYKMSQMVDPHSPRYSPRKVSKKKRRLINLPLSPFVVALVFSLALPPSYLLSSVLLFGPFVYLCFPTRYVVLFALYLPPIVCSHLVPLPLFILWVVSLPVLHWSLPLAYNYCHDRHNEFMRMSELLKEMENEKKRKQKKQKKEKKRPEGVKEE